MTFVPANSLFLPVSPGQNQFGEQSVESNTIHGILGAFKARKITKREAHSAIFLTLGNHDNLKEDLMDVLFHKDANWGPGDFDLNQCFTPLRRLPQSQPQLQPAPEFLQPEHQPQVRMPSMFPAWYSAPQTIQSISPAMLNRYGGYAGLEHHEPELREPQHVQYENHSWPLQTQFGISSPILHTPSQFKYSEPLSSSATQDIARVSSYTGTNCENVHSSPKDDFNGNKKQQQHSYDQWGKEGHGNSWGGTGSIHLPKRTQSHASNDPHSYASSFENCSPHLASSIPPFSDATSPAPGTSIAIPIGQSVLDMPPPPRGRARKESSYIQIGTGADSNHNSDVEGCSQLPTEDESSLSHHSSDAQSNAGNKKMQSQGQGRFIHSLCGKAFSTRSRVKQHHWGKKIDDLATTTGCWVKYKRPNVNWNEHASCKAEPSKPHTIKKKSSGGLGQNSVQLLMKRGSAQPVFRQEMNEAASPSPRTSAVALPTMNQQQIIPDFLTLQDLPRRVAQTPRSRTLSRSSIEGAQMYHTHQLSPQGQFDALLTAANTVSKIDAPKPQGRHDSVVSHLDAQAAIAERNMQHSSAWTFPHGEQEYADLGYIEHHLPSFGTSGLGISTSLYGDTQVPRSILAPSQAGLGGTNSPTMPLSTAGPEYI